MPAEQRCANCDAVVSGNYCGDCGQRVRQLDSTVALLKEAAEEVFTVDGRFLRTLRLLVTRPGHVPAEYIRGRRQSYTSPVRLFLGASAGFFFVFLATRSIAARYYGFDPAGAESYANGMSAMLLLVVPLIAAALKLLYIRPARPLVHHLVFVLYSAAAALLWFLVVTLFAATLRTWFAHYTAAPAWLPEFAYWLHMPSVALVGIYLAIALRRTYGSSWPGAAMRSIVVLVVLAALYSSAIPALLARLERTVF